MKNNNFAGTKNWNSRYQAIMFPLRPHISKSTTKVIIVIIWIISAVLAIPMALAYIIERNDYMVRERDNKAGDTSIILLQPTTPLWHYQHPTTRRMTDPSFLSVYQRTLTLNCSSGTRISSVWFSTSYLVFLSVVHTSGTRHHTIPDTAIIMIN